MVWPHFFSESVVIMSSDPCASSVMGAGDLSQQCSAPGTMAPGTMAACPCTPPSKKSRTISPHPIPQPATVGGPGAAARGPETFDEASFVASLPPEVQQFDRDLDEWFAAGIAEDEQKKAA